MLTLQCVYRAGLSTRKLATGTDCGGMRTIELLGNLLGDTSLCGTYPEARVLFFDGDDP